MLIFIIPPPLFMGLAHNILLYFFSFLEFVGNVIQRNDARVKNLDSWHKNVFGEQKSVKSS
jgi:hypothetical protein